MRIFFRASFSFVVLILLCHCVSEDQYAGRKATRAFQSRFGIDIADHSSESYCYRFSSTYVLERYKIVCENDILVHSIINRLGLKKCSDFRAGALFDKPIAWWWYPDKKTFIENRNQWDSQFKSGEMDLYSNYENLNEVPKDTINNEPYICLWWYPEKKIFYMEFTDD